jgi:dipeptidase D
MPALDIITMGPNMADIHTPDERMEINSFINCYEILKDFIAVL